jgi:glycosyltransferase involved in cell wall biosynthesis
VITAPASPELARVAAVAASVPCEVFVHAPCGRGDTLAGVASRFRRAFGVEPAETLFAQAQLRVAGHPQVTLVHGDPGEFVRAQVQALAGIATFWLIDLSAGRSDDLALAAARAPLGAGSMLLLRGVRPALLPCLRDELSRTCREHRLVAAGDELWVIPAGVTVDVDALATGRHTEPAPGATRPTSARGRLHGAMKRAGRWLVPHRLHSVQYEPRPLRVPAPPRRRLSDTSLPSIAVVTPSYNQARFLDRTIRSVLDQHYAPLQYVVQDGGSDDGSVAVIERWAPRLTAWESVRDQGQADAVNRGFAKASGEIMAWLNSDDLLLPGSLQVVGEYFATHPAVDVVYGNRIVIDADDGDIGRWIVPGHVDELLSWADYVPQETLFWRRRIWEAAGGRVDVSFRYALDWDLLLRFRAAGARFVHLPRFLGAFRFHPGQKSGIMTDDVGRVEMQRVRRSALGFDPTRRQVRWRMRRVVFGSAWHGLLHDARSMLGILGEVPWDDAAAREAAQ